MEIRWTRSLPASFPALHWSERLHVSSPGRRTQSCLPRALSHVFEVRKATVFGRSLDERIPDYEELTTNKASRDGPDGSNPSNQT